MRSSSRSELFELVCEAAAQGGKFTSTIIALARPDSDFLEYMAAAGPTADSARLAQISVNAAHPEGHGLSGTAFRSGKPCIANDYLANRETQAFHALEYEGTTYDCGDKIGLLRANVAFALRRPDLADEARAAILALL